MLSKMWSKQFVINSLWAKVIGTPLLEIFRYWIGALLSYVLLWAGLGLKKMTSIHGLA